MPTLKEATTPPANMKNMSLVTQPAQLPPSPAYSMPGFDALSVAPAPAVMAQDVDQQRQFYRPGVSQFRISPIPPKQNLQSNAATRSIAANVASQAVANSIFVQLNIPNIFSPATQVVRPDSSGLIDLSFALAPELSGTFLAGAAS